MVDYSHEHDAQENLCSPEPLSPIFLGSKFLRRAMRKYVEVCTTNSLPVVDHSYGNENSRSFGNYSD